MHVGFQIQGKLTELVFDFSFEDAVAELSSMNARLSLYRNWFQAKVGITAYTRIVDVLFGPDLAFRNGFRDDMDYQDKGKKEKEYWQMSQPKKGVRYS